MNQMAEGNVPAGLTMSHGDGEPKARRRSAMAGDARNAERGSNELVKERAQ
jgi:hypothetical protein